VSEDTIPLEPGILHGTSTQTIKKLLAGGYLTVNSVAYATPKEIVENTAIAGVDTAEKAIAAARDVLDAGFITAEELYVKLEHEKLLHTGCNALDGILGGGITPGIITEFVAAFKGGKTQICKTLAVMCTRPVEEGGWGGDVVYIDTENTFVPRRIKQIAETRGYDGDEVLRRIHAAKPATSAHMLALVNKLNEFIPEHNVKLVIVDSLIAQFRNEYRGRGNLAERQGLIAGLLGKLLRVARAYNVAVVITNQMQARPDAMFTNPDKPTGGHIVGHASTIRVVLRLAKGNSRVAKILDSSYLPEEACRFLITEAGVVDEQV